jgi:hypothetical protein
MEKCWGLGVDLNSAFDGGGSFTIGRFIPGDRTSSVDCIEGWVGPRASLEAVE